jgi:hypothetical protein
MLENLSIDIQKDIHILSKILDNKYRYSRPEDREIAINLLKEHISDIVITMLLIEHKKFNS